MKRSIVFVGTVIVAACVAFSVLGTSWEEQKAGFQFRVDPKTGETQVGFYLFLEYEPIPACTDLDTTWSVYILQDGSEEVLADYHYRKRHPSCTGRTEWISFLSPFITPVAGGNYGARITVHDFANDLFYERVISYIAPLSLPTGVALSVSTTSGDTDEIDLSGVPDEELEQLASYFTTFSTDYVQTASDVSVEDFFTIYATSEEAFPAWLLVVVSLGPDVSTSGSGISIKASYNRILFIYPVNSPAAVGGVLEQLSLLNEEFVGRVLLAKNPSDSGNAISVFIGEIAWQVLQAASQEIEQR